MTDGPSRRRRTVLATCAAGLASLAGCGNPLSGSGDDGSTPTEDDESPGAGGDGSPTETDGSAGGANGSQTDGGAGSAGGQTVRLGGETQGWVGQAPDAIADETNPTLELRAGTTYEITWENLDGAEHELIVTDENGEEVAASEESEEQGETVTMELDVEEGLAEYYCEYHPEAMRGQITVVQAE